MMRRVRNWLGESWKDEVLRRLEAVEGSIQECHLRVNELDGRINEALNDVRPYVTGPEDEPYNRLGN